MKLSYSNAKETKTMKMRESRILRTIKEGKTAVTVKLNMSDIRGVDVACMCGFDGVWIDLEHVPNDISVVENTVRAAKVFDCDVITRVQRGGYNNYIKPLEADSTAIMVPHLMSLKEAKEIVYYTKFHPIGRRPLDGGNADGAYCMIDALEYMEQANKERFVIVQIEDPEPLAELDEICALPGIDMIFFGPADFTQGIGAPCQFGDPRVADARKKVVETAKKYGKLAGTTGGVGSFEEYSKMGYDLVNVHADVCALQEVYLDVIKQIRG